MKEEWVFERGSEGRIEGYGGVLGCIEGME